MTQSKRDPFPTAVSKELAATLYSDPILDAEFYSENFMYKGTSDRAAIAAHFIGNSAFDLRPSSAELDPIAYLAAYPDVEASGMHPSLHYAAYGRKEGRRIERVRSRQVSKALSLTDLREDAIASPRTYQDHSIAITAHVFYEDYITYFLFFLARLPFKFDLYVSVPNRDLEVRARRFSSLPNVGKLVVETVPNKGRNFLGLFTRFARQLVKYDFFAHVHSKKSLYTGSARTDWGLHYVSGVLGGVDHINAVFRIFERDPTVGTVSADRHHRIPYWAAHWLQNFHIAKQLVQPLKGCHLTDGFIDYPIGGMFWARTEAIRPLLELGLREDDFPEEFGQTDGTVQHALERLVGVLPRANGFSHVKYSAREARYIWDTDLWKHDYLAMTKGAAQSMIENSNVVSFDLFDTLVLRDASSPDEAKDRVPETAIDPDFKYPEYLSSRNQSELSLRKDMNFRGDVRLQDVVLRLADTTGTSVDEASAAVTSEATLDLQLFRRRESMLALYESARRSGKRVIVVSDTYYPASFIHQVFAKLNIPLPDELYLSCERQMRKDTGELWNLVKQCEPLEGGFIHFGDNIVSDVQLLADRGLTGVFVCKATDKLHLLKILNHPPDRRLWPLVSRAVFKFGDDPFFG